MRSFQSLNQMPRSVRFLRRGFHILQRPSVWGAGIILGGAMIFLAQYWSQLSSRPNSSDRLSQTLDRSIDEANQPPLSLDPFSDDGTSADRLSEFKVKQPTLIATGSSKPRSANPTAAQAASINPAPTNAVNSTTNESLSFNAVALPESLPSLANGGTSSASPPSSNGLFQSNSVQPNNGVSPLQAALDRGASQSPSAQISTEAGVGAQLSSTANGPGNNLPSSSTSTGYPALAPMINRSSPSTAQAGSAASGVRFVPQTSPPIGTTGYTLPPSYANPSVLGVNSSRVYPSGVILQPVPGQIAQPGAIPFQGYGPPSSTVPQSGYSTSPYTNSARTNVPSQPPVIESPAAPFSIPRNAPGQHIGGGQINTFSNP